MFRALLKNFTVNALQKNYVVIMPSPRRHHERRHAAEAALTHIMRLSPAKFSPAAFGPQ